MSLLNKILTPQPTVTPAPPTAAQVKAASPAPAVDNIIDIEQRDEMLAAIAAAPLDPTHGGAIDRLLRLGYNRATLDAATKIAYKLKTSELIRRYGQPANELKTATDWNAESQHQKKTA